MTFTLQPVFNVKQAALAHASPVAGHSFQTGEVYPRLVPMPLS